ncbi:RNA-binding transcriptional accessory protein [Agarivorans sp. TSD2052]|uniref:Tex family protein n=1 Tax=Agarivorans sp. TSD2052 TaxID=2937286 RepID=UPI00200ECDA2|nr:Tex family protein [Agarivorans sp. TSD2052]UPW19098.1 RNA-binding transcriptional accessory protein [Agarivorans sp. TSD2052]
MSNIEQQIATDISASYQQVSAAIKLLDEGATVPFIARYRKEATGGLDDGQLRTLEQRLSYLRDMQQRRLSILKSIAEQDKLTPQLEQAINATSSKTELEDLYLPYKPKRRTKGQIAIEAGLEPLAEALLQQPDTVPEILAEEFINLEAGFADSKAVLDGCKFILMERFAVQAPLLARLRQYLLNNAQVKACVIEGQKINGQKFQDYFDYQEAIGKIPSHRALAILRGRNEGVLNLSVEVEQTDALSHPAEQIVRDYVQLTPKGVASDQWVNSVVQWTWRVKLKLQLETELLNQLRERADDEAISVFSRNLNDLLMAAPAGPKATLGLDPGLRTGVKVAVVDATGKLVAYDTIYPHAPRNNWQGSLTTLASLVTKYHVKLLSVGNGTASRETDKLAADLISMLPPQGIQKVMVSEAGASVYSASELAANEFPDLDVSIRGAVSIARRLQDPLAELVKIEPKAIGVGQYQHDVSQSKLSLQLDSVVEDCVNAVGVDINMASAPLLSFVAGLNTTIAQNIVTYRDENGAFTSRTAIKKVARLGPKAFEQAAGFLRINHAKNALDGSAVHPEAYPVVEAIAKHSQCQVSQLIANNERLDKLDPKQFTNDKFGLPTVTDIIAELKKPGRDPRPEFATATFKEGVNTINDLKPAMRLEGVVTNVTNFGAFVDVGVHQDGLVHISCLANHFVKDPHQVVKAGDIVKVKVLELEPQRKRIALSMRLDDEVQANKTSKPVASQTKQRSAPKPKANNTGSAKPINSAFADAFAKAKK